MLRFLTPAKHRILSLDTPSHPFLQGSVLTGFPSLPMWNPFLCSLSTHMWGSLPAGQRWLCPRQPLMSLNTSSCLCPWQHITSLSPCQHQVIVLFILQKPSGSGKQKTHACPQMSEYKLTMSDQHGEEQGPRTQAFQGVEWSSYNISILPTDHLMGSLFQSLQRPG